MEYRENRECRDHMEHIECKDCQNHLEYRVCWDHLEHMEYRDYRKTINHMELAEFMKHMKWVEPMIHTEYRECRDHTECMESVEKPYGTYKMYEVCGMEHNDYMEHIYNIGAYCPHEIYLVYWKHKMHQVFPLKISYLLYTLYLVYF